MMKQILPKVLGLEVQNIIVVMGKWAIWYTQQIKKNIFT